MPITRRSHLFPFRTQKLSSVVPKILGWRRPGKIGRCRLSLCPFSRVLARWQGLFFFASGARPSLYSEVVRTATERPRWCVYGVARRRWTAFAPRGQRPGPSGAFGRKRKDRLLQVMQRKRAFPRPAQRCGGVMTVVADSLHSGKGQDQAALLGRKLQRPLLEVLAKKKSVPEAAAA